MKETKLKAFRILPDTSKNEFMKMALQSIAESPNSPIDVFDSKFEAVEEGELQFISVATKSKIAYSCSIGYDRTEQYQTTDRMYVSPGDYYTYKGVKKLATRAETVQVDCIKERVVTDWQTINGTNESEENAVAYIGEFDAKKYPCFSIEEELAETGWSERVEILNSSNTIKMEELSPQDAGEYSKIVEASILDAQARCEYKCFERVEFPGDHVKDENYNGASEIVSVEKLVVPVYSCSYNYKGENYRICGISAGKKEPALKEKMVGYTMPMVEQDEKQDKQEALKTQKWIMLSAIIPALIAIILSAMGKSGFGLFGIVAFVVLAVGYYTYRKKLVEIRERKLQIKKERLAEYIKNNLQ